MQLMENGSNVILHFAVHVGMWVGQRARACCMINESDHDDTLRLFIYRYQKSLTVHSIPERN